jgi:hypothetical protein
MTGLGRSAGCLGVVTGAHRTASWAKIRHPDQPLNQPTAMCLLRAPILSRRGGQAASARYYPEVYFEEVWDRAPGESRATRTEP